MVAFLRAKVHDGAELRHSCVTHLHFYRMSKIRQDKISIAYHSTHAPKYAPEKRGSPKSSGEKNLISLPYFRWL